MFRLLADGPDAPPHWEHPLDSGERYVLGRDPGAEVSVPWDPRVSRRHLLLKVTADAVELERLPEATNPVFYAGTMVDACRLAPGEPFIVGSTVFQIVRSDARSSSERPVEEVTFEPQQLRSVRFRDADKRIDVLSHLPEVIWGARSDSELHLRLAQLLLAGVARAEAVATVALDGDAVQMLHWDRRRETAGEFRPSSRLVCDALVRRRRSVLHVWEARLKSAPDYTEMAEFDWAFCTPVAQAAGRPWGLYVAGKLDRAHGAAEDGVLLQADVKFAELVAEIISSVQRLNRLERQQAGLRQFFAPPILSALGEDLNTDLLEPRECEVTVLFCDLRGFSQKAEESAGDLLGLLDRVSRALEVMTHHILRHGGVTGDFQGDAALGFWGWPFASDESAVNACRAALGIRRAFAENFGRPGHPLADFEMGIGIAHGRAVAGKIGTSEQVKVTVFGPVVNLAKRLESMTRQLRASILLDEATARLVRQRLDPQQGRVRKLARVLPYGMEVPLMVSELLPPEAESPELTDSLLAEYERGVDCFVAGHWEEAYRCLHAMPAGDRAQDFLSMLIAQHNRIAPPDWDGVVRLPSK